jgi:hypothetical protein
VYGICKRQQKKSEKSKLKNSVLHPPAREDDLLACARQIAYHGGPYASPCELEALPERLPETDFTFIEVSESGMDEEMLSDFRADVVPPGRTWRDLRESQADEALTRRTMGEYPLRYARILFPTAGRSAGLLVGLRRIARREPVIVFKWDSSSTWPTNRLSDWDAGRVLRNIETYHLLGGGHHWFAGPKHLALKRMLRRAAVRGKVVVLVLPESPIYNEQVIDASGKKSFETSLAELAAQVPEAKWIRLDRIPELDSNEYFQDLAHLNAYARPIVTAALLKQLEPITHAR